MTGDFEIDDFFERHLDAMCTERLLQTLTGMDKAGMTLVGASISPPKPLIIDYVNVLDRAPIQMTTEVNMAEMLKRFKRLAYGTDVKLMLK
jgi:hypothetical protein